ncbi:hypothetical protein D3C86_1430350 [compost metagenome]
MPHRRRADQPRQRHATQRLVRRGARGLGRHAGARLQHARRIGKHAFARHGLVLGVAQCQRQASGLLRHDQLVDLLQRHRQHRRLCALAARHHLLGALGAPRVVDRAGAVGQHAQPREQHARLAVGNFLAVAAQDHEHIHIVARLHLMADANHLVHRHRHGALALGHLTRQPGQQLAFEHGHVGAERHHGHLAGHARDVLIGAGRVDRQLHDLERIGGQRLAGFHCARGDHHGMHRRGALHRLRHCGLARHPPGQQRQQRGQHQQRDRRDPYLPAVHVGAPGVIDMAGFSAFVSEKIGFRYRGRSAPQPNRSAWRAPAPAARWAGAT